MSTRSRIAFLVALLVVSAVAFGPRIADRGFTELKERLISRSWEAYEHFSERIPDAVPVLDLRLSRRDIIHFRKTYADFEDLDPELRAEFMAVENRWRGADLYRQGQRQDVQVKLHGREPYLHRMGVYWSLSLKVANRYRLGSRRKPKLVIYERIAEGLDVLKVLAQEFGVWVSPSTLVAITGVGPDQKLYALEERLDRDYLDRIGLPQTIVLEDDIDQGHALVLGIPLDTRAAAQQTPSATLAPERTDALRARAAIALEPWVDPRVGRQQILARLMALADAQSAGEGLSEFVDPDVAARLMAAQMIGGLNGHGFYSGNLVLLYDMSTGRLRPLLHRDNFWNQLPEHAGEYLQNGGSSFALSFVSALTRDDEIREKKYTLLGAFLNDEAAIAGLLERMERVNDFHSADLHPLGNTFRRALQPPFQDAIASNIEVVRAHLSAANPALSLTDGALAIDPSAMAPHGITSLTLATEGDGCPAELILALDGEALERVPLRQTAGGCEIAHAFRTPLFDGLNTVVERVPRTYHLRSSAPIRGASLALANRSLTHEAPHVLTVGAVPEPGAPARPAPPATDRVWGPGEHVIATDTLLPRGTSVTIAPGTDVLLGPAVSVVIRGSLRAHGTAEAPIRVQRLDPALAFGSFAVVGDGHEDASVQHFYLEGGSEAWLAGVLYTGCLAIHNVPTVTLRDVEVRACEGEDGLNIKRADVTIERLHIMDNLSDGVDLDYCDGEIRDSRFWVSDALKHNANGDGLDVSGANLVIRNSRFEGLPDKGLSVGEASRVVLADSEIRRSTLGVAIKDLSQVLLSAVDFVENQTDIAAYRKKDVFGGGTAQYQNLSATPNQSVDALSSISQVKAPIPVPDDSTALGATFDRLFEPSPPQPLSFWDNATWKELLDRPYRPF